MSEQPAPSLQTIIDVQRKEMNRINDNRVYLLATIEEIKVEANAEIGRLNGVISQMKATEMENQVFSELVPESVD